MKVLVIGSRGMLGYDLVPALRRAGYVVIGADVRGEAADDFALIDITRKESVDEVMARLAPGAVINCAAYTNVDGAEADEATAYAVNALGPWHLALACRELDIPLMQISTDYVFDGLKGSSYDEYDVPNPQGVYGRSKRAGEVHVERLCPRHYLVRTAWLFGHGGKNFVETILQAGKARPELRVVNDQWGSPTWARDLSEVLVLLLGRETYGTYHVTGQGACTWFDFATEILRQAGIPTPVLPQSTAQSARPAPRPAYSVMRNRALELTGIPLLRPWQDALARYGETRPASLGVL